MLRFKIGLSRSLNKLSLISSLILLVQEAKMSKWSASTNQPHCKRWSGIAESFTFLTLFSDKLEIPICFAALLKNMPIGYIIISNIGVTTHIIIVLERCFADKR